MGDLVQKQVYSGWPGGLFSTDEQLIAAKEFLLRADNVVIGDGGALRPRPRFVTYGVNDAATNVIGIFQDSTLYVHCLDKKIFQVSTNTTVTTMTTAGRGQFIKFKDVYCFANGIDPIWVWDDNWAAAGQNGVAFGSPPVTRILEVHNERVFAANGTTLYETAPDTAPNTAVDYFATGASWPINAGSGKPITAMKSLGKQGLFVFNRDEIHLQSGYTKQERQTRLFVPGIGTVSPDSLQAVTLAGFGECIIFLGTDKKLYAVNLSGVIEIGSYVQAELDEVWEGACVDDTRPANETKHRAVSAYHPKGYYYLGYARTNANNEAAWDRCLCVHVSKQIPGMQSWPITRMAGTGQADEFPVSFAALANIYDVTRRSVMSAFKNEGGEYWCYLFDFENEADYDGAYGGGTTYYIPWEIRTINDNFGDDLTLKGFYELVIMDARTRVGYVPFKYDEMIDTDVSELTSGSVGAIVTTVGKVYRSKAELRNTGARVSIKLRTDTSLSNAYGYILNGMEIRYIPAGLP